METNEACHYVVETAYTPFAYLSIVKVQAKITAKYTRIAYIVVGALILAFDFWYTITHLKPDLSTILRDPALGVFISLTLIGLWIFLSGIQVEKKLAKKMFKANYKNLQKATYRFYTTFMTADHPQDYILKYENVHSVFETKDYFLIFASENAVNVIDKTGFKKGGAENFRTFLEKATGKTMAFAK